MAPSLAASGAVAPVATVASAAATRQLRVWQVWRRRLRMLRPGGLTLALLVLGQEVATVAAATAGHGRAEPEADDEWSDSLAEGGPRPDTFPSSGAVPLAAEFGDDISFAPGISESSMRGRRLVAVTPAFEVAAVDLTNINAEPKSTDNVNVRAGVLYSKIIIHALSGLGTSKQTIRAKLVPYDMKSTLKTCATVEAYMGFPFNGAESAVDQGITPENIRNVFSAVTFPNAGLFRLCYSPDGLQWQELGPSITVFGAESSSNKFWCPKSNLKDEKCQLNASDIGCECRGQVEGFKRNNITAKFMSLGLPNPAWPVWRASLTYVDKECGTADDADPFNLKVTDVANYVGYEIHNFGGITPGKDLGVWKICYCAGFDADNGAGTGGVVNACANTAPQDFPQEIGQLVVIDVVSLMGEAGTRDITVYPTLRFGLVVHCGHNGVNNREPDSISGGCSTSLSPRYKLIKASTESDKAYYDADAGCRFMPQAYTYKDGTKVHGGHLGPDNCDGPSTCNDQPEKVVSGKAPTFLDVQLDASYENGVMVAGDYDVCYCDDDCLNSMYWFKAGTLEVETVKVRFTTDYLSGSFAEDQAIVNTGRFLAIMGIGTAYSPVQGSWSGDGPDTKTREMKFLRDDDGNVDKQSCLSTPQPNVVSGHRLVSGNTDFTEPETILEADDPGRPRGQLYGKVCDSKVPPTCAPNIRISVPGWYAVCYCDSNCNEVNNWAVYGRQLVAGPTAKQSWTRYTGVTFSIDIAGNDLKITNRAIILSTSQQAQDCGNFMSTTRVDGPKSSAKLHTSATSDSKIFSIVWSYMGTEISFSRTHGLKDGDRVRLSGVNVEGSNTGSKRDLEFAQKRSEMFNTVHTVFVACDDDDSACWKILIPVKFPAAEFPVINNVESVIWVQTSKETFAGIKVGDGNESPEGRGYVVCWCNDCSGGDSSYPFYVGQAGSITVKKPMSMPEAYLGLTTVMPDVSPGFNGPGGPVVIAFKTGDIAHYATATGQLHLCIEIMPGLVAQGATRDNPDTYADVLLPRTNKLTPLELSTDIDEPTEARQDFCGLLFTELWSEDPDGFPMPDGCYYSEDITNPDMRVKQLHIIFTERNHLKKNTKYMVVTNMNLLKELDKDFPGDGAIWIWSMDDVFNNPFGVIERGDALPSPSLRVPPRNALRELQLSGGPNQGFPRFHNENNPPDGFMVLGTSGAKAEELFSFCIPHDEKNPSSTPPEALECSVCYKEEDCGNGGGGVDPDPAKSYCRSPINAKCPNANGDLVNVPSFMFRIKAKPGYPIKPQSILRLFLHPLTQWDIGVSCQVAMELCASPSIGGQCSNPICQSESVVGGQVVGISEYPINIMKIILPNIMLEVSDQNYNIIKVANLPLPPGGFFPQVVTAELMKDGNTAPDYWNMNQALAAAASGGSARLYIPPKILAASIVNSAGDGNQAPFRADNANKLYVRLVFGTTFAGSGNGVDIDFKLPFGYVCDTPTNGGSVPELNVLASKFPSTKGRLGGRLGEVRYKNIPATPTVMCRLTLLQDMVIYAKTVYFVELTVNNPRSAMKRDDVLNYWNISVTHNGYSPIEYVQDIQLSSKQLRNCDAPRQKLLCLEEMGTQYASGIAVLGKLSDFFIAPSEFGAGNKNTLSIFFMTEQEVGDLKNTETELWVDAPSSFDFGKYCSAKELDKLYYIPEGRGTAPLPTGVLIPCRGAPTSENELTFNRAKVSTSGRLLRATFYGFTVQVTNGPIYVRTQLNAWRLWTYVKTTGYAVDGAYETARFNEKVPAGPDSSWGMYARGMPAGNMQVSFSSLRPSVIGAAPSDITILPIIVAVPMSSAVRITAPAGYEWDFEQVEFRYQAPAPGVNPLNVVEGAEADIPISGKPARPNSEPKNVLTMDYMQMPWQPGLIYGFACKIRIPMVPPSATANQFTIEFGYNEDLHENRLEAGVTPAPMVQRLINGVISYTTSVMGRSVDITFSVRTISHIPNGGGLVIIGPPNFIFSKYCQPKPADGFPELPYDTTCLYEPITATGQPNVDIIAGPMGIPPKLYKFSLAGKNPPQAMKLVDAGVWTILSYSLISEKIVLDQGTVIPAYAVAIPMVSASFRMYPRVDCFFISPEERAIDASLPETFCDFEHWQFYPPRGYRDDRPLRPSQLIIKFQLADSVDSEQTMLIRAPVGYVFDAECRVVTYPSSRIFDDTAYDGVQLKVPDNVPLDPRLPHTMNPDKRLYQQRYDLWPVLADTISCLGRRNEARLTLGGGLQLYKGYLMRLSVLNNPAVTPDYNYFVLEYNGEASEPFAGVDIWAFGNTSVIATTTASSRADYPTFNLVTITLRPVNTVPNGGHLRVTAPSAFVVPTQCRMTLAVHELEKPNASAVPAGVLRANLLRWSQFSDEDLVCEGDTTPSSRGRLLLTRNNKYLNGHVLYVMTIQVTNPQTTSSTADEWHLESYEDLTVNTIIDETYVAGFPINTAVQSFAYLTPESSNAGVQQRLDFNMSFPDTVVIGDMLIITAPVSYFFSEPGDNRCHQYVFLDGSMTKTIPSCSANTITWNLQDESIPALTGIRFMVEVKNPRETPDINLFQVKQMGVGNVRKSSRMITGYEIIPQLRSPSVTEASPVEKCRSDVKVVTGMPCQGTGSLSSVVVRFTPTRSGQLVSLQARVDDDKYDFTNAVFQDGVNGAITIYGRSKEMLVAREDVHGGVEITLRIERVLNPMTPGIAMWSVTTYNLGDVEGVPRTTTVMPIIPCSMNNGECGQFPIPEARRDEKLDLESMRVLGYMLALTSSSISPIYYAIPDAVTTFEIKGETAHLVNDVLRITRPPGYTLLPGTLRGLTAVSFGPNGLDYMRKFSKDFENPEDYYAVLTQPIPVGTLFRFQLKVSSPDLAEKVMNWVFRSYRVLPLLDEDGEIADASMPTYPWLGREILPTGTNDGAFSGFLLVGQVPFTMQPSLQTPGADIRLTLNFGIADGVEADQYVRMEVTGPAGFVFKDSCLFTGSSQFSKCTGFKNQASLVTVRSRLIGTDITVQLSASNPGITPSPNNFYLAIFQDEKTQYVRYSQALSYEIQGMGVVYKGNNQLGETASGFFTFTPVRNSPSAILYIVVTPPPNSGFRVLCTGISPLGFLNMPNCTSGSVNEPLTLRFPNATLTKGKAYTIGVRVLNPGGIPSDENNYWGISLQDYTTQTFDANLRIPGLELKSMPLRCNGIGWTTSTPMVLGTVMVQLRVMHPIPAGTIQKLVIRAPEGIMYNEDPNNVKVLPFDLPLRLAIPTQVAGDLLSLWLDENSPIDIGTYNIRFDISNPTVYPHDNTWSIFAQKDIIVDFSHVITGYMEGQESPFDISVATSIPSSLAVRGVRAGFELILALCLVWLLGIEITP